MSNSITLVIFSLSKVYESIYESLAKKKYENKCGFKVDVYTLRVLFMGPGLRYLNYAVKKVVKFL